MYTIGWKLTLGIVEGTVDGVSTPRPVAGSVREVVMVK
jgi:hypothetical protein